MLPSSSSPRDLRFLPGSGRFGGSVEGSGGRDEPLFTLESDTLLDDRLTIAVRPIYPEDEILKFFS